MRLWHKDLIDVLPRQQLLGQWRELNSMFKLENKHMLVNYAYANKQALLTFSQAVICEMIKRKYKVNLDAHYKYFNETINNGFETFEEHDDEYLVICYYNLKEKFLRGGMTEREWHFIDCRFKELMGEKNGRKKKHN